MLAKQTIDYHDGDTILEGYIAHDKMIKTKKPAVIVAHDWSGKNAFACHKAEKLAELGYVGFALDLYGKGKIGKTKEEKMALMQPFMQDRKKLLHRLLSALKIVKSLNFVDETRIGAIGFCFGGLCVLDLARSGADLKGIVSFHGLLNAPENHTKQPIRAKLLVLHGYDDPMVTPEQVIMFANDMTEAKADWQIDMYGHALHAFTNPDANDAAFGTVYNKEADARSWVAMKDFFKEVF